MRTEQEKAIELRKQGRSTCVIAKELGCAKSTIYEWTKDIQLSLEQKRLLSRRLGNKASTEKWKAIRIKAQEEGKKKAEVLKNQINWKYIAACMLYWAEGSKGRNMVQLSNTDPYMMKFFVSFLIEIGVKSDEIAVSVVCYLNNGLSLEEIENFWINFLDLPDSCLRKATVNTLPSSSRGKIKTRHKYGVCRVCVCNTELVQQIFGAIQELGEFKREDWLNGRCKTGSSCSLTTE